MAEIIQRSFTSGEIAPALRSRADLTKYATGLGLCENFIVRPQGGIYSRPGLRFIGEVGDSTKRARLIPFQFNTEQTYILLFEDQSVRIIRDGGFVLKPAATMTDVTQANPAVVTTSADHTFVTGESVTITGVVGMTELNGNTYTITVLTPTTFQLDSTDSTGFAAYSSDGSAQSDGIYEVVTPYLEADLSRIGYTQSADVMTLVHPDYEPRNLSRTADNAWSLDVINYAPTVDAPDLRTGASVVVNITDIAKVLVASKFRAQITTDVAHGFATGDVVFLDSIGGMTELNGRYVSITVTDTDIFFVDDIDVFTYGSYTSGGTVTRFENIGVIGTGGGTYQKKYYYVVTAVDGNGVESLPSEVSTIETSSLSTTYGVRLSWQPIDGAAYYRVYKDPSEDTGIFGWIGDTDKTFFADYNIAPITSDAPPTDRQPFTGVGNRPSAVSYYQQRQIFANTYNEPQTVFTTQTGNYSSLRVSNPARDDDAVTFTIAGKQVNEIRHIVSLDALILLTSGGEWIATEGQDQVLTPSTIGVRPQSYNGASWVPPVIINSTALYVQEKGARIRDLGYEFASDKYTGNDLSLMSEHLFEDYTVEEMAFSQEPYGVLWCVRSDGVLLGLTYQREHQVWGWHQHSTSGVFESVATVSEDGRDALYVVVKRTINGSTVRYVERMEKRFTDAPENCFCVDSGLTYSNGAVSTVSGLDHLEGQTVVALADGNVVKNLTVSGGSVTLPQAASVIHVGLPYTPAMETLDIEQVGGETLKPKKINVSQVTLEVLKSRGGWIGPRSDELGAGQLYEIKPRFGSDGYDTISLKTFKQDVYIEPSWNQSGGVRVEQRDPLPLAILSISPEVSVGG